MPTLEELRKTRIQKLENIKKAGIDPYPAESFRSHMVGEVLSQFIELSRSKAQIIVAGRLMSLRKHGGSTFGDLGESDTIQLFFKKDILGDEKYQFFLDNFDIGDFVEVSGILIKTKVGEQTLEVQDFRILTKTLLPLPEKWHGLQDVEERFRKRYLDIIFNPSEKELFIKKSKFWQATRDFLSKEGGLEVETPALERVPGGADAEPFITHMNALNIDLYLRISPELHLKRLIVAGFEKVFEIGRIFRNEGIDKEHLQDYTQMEMYWAYTDYEKLMKLLEKLIKYVIKETLGTYVHSWNDMKVDWAGPWERIDYYKVFKKYTDIDLNDAAEKELKSYATENKIDIAKHIGRGRLIDIIFKKMIRPYLVKPAFLILPPVDIEPLAKRWPKDPNRVERFQVIAGGTELGKGFSELNDPQDQKNRFKEQVKLGKAGDKEAQKMDEDFVEALEYGMPPTAGFGYSERLFAFLMNRPIRDIVFFPIMRPK